MSARQKEAELLPLVHEATDCIVRKFSRTAATSDLRPAKINDLIVDAIGMRAAGAGHDRCANRLYGDGTERLSCSGPISTYCRRRWSGRSSSRRTTVDGYDICAANAGRNTSVTGSVTSTSAATTISAVGTPKASPRRP